MINSDRVEFLSKLEERVKTGNIVPFKYHDIINGEDCYCILGHAFDIVGKRNMIYNLENQLNVMQYESLPIDFRIEEEIGLELIEIIHLQKINDNNYENDEEQKKELLEYICRLKKGDL